MSTGRSQAEEEFEDMEVTVTTPSYVKAGKSCVSLWLDKMSKGVLGNADFKEHWRVWVPKIYNLEPNGNCLDCIFDEHKAQKVLFRPLEEFICNGDPELVLNQLKGLDNPPTICAKVFKYGEPTYTCRECGLDTTCVLCVDCFKQSSHKNHKYKMGTSCGGGCCDCGDVEAWKKDPSCKIHSAGGEAKESGNTLPADIAERAVAVFEALLKYCYDLLSLGDTPGLPADLYVENTEEDPLGLPDSVDTYCTVLFNDEIHTFEQVINTLTRVIKCSQKDAIEFVTCVDREGRTVVKCSDFDHCNELKAEIEKFTSRNSNQPLKVLVVHSHVIAHQTFAMKLLNWLQQFISICKGFRALFSKVALNKNLPEITIVEGILIGDSRLWKSARTAWHSLFISGMLMEYESKKALAVVFTYNYNWIMKGFITDDHDHTFSIVSFTVQLYTVPTLAHHLIAHHDALFILLNTLISETYRRCNSRGKLAFDRNTPNLTFKRALFIIFDIRYLLGTVPDVWTDELRRGFLQGFSLLLKLFCTMQNMEPVVRQVGQHMEYEPEWETGFQLHIKLSSVITLALEWCASDRIVLIKAFRQVLRRLYEERGNYETQVRELADHTATCLQYNVATGPVSLHLPLSRFLAGLFLHLERYNLHFQSAEFIYETKPAPEYIVEPVLCAQAMIAQVHAGMWRRNGYSLVTQLHFYQSPRCRTEMLDKDIVLLQVGACLIESNEFLIHILNRFNLLNWANPDFESSSLNSSEEDSIRQTISFVEEFLGLLITIIGERYVPGIGQVKSEDCLKKEIIQQLSIKNLSHSELSRTLPDNTHVETEMESVIEDVAEFKKPQQAGGKAVYTLKSDLYPEYNVFFYHYTKEDLSKSEEEQRKRRKARGELECCPPPKLPKLTESFSFIANLLQCDVMLHIMRTILERALNLTARSFSEPQVHKILHLIGYALQEQESGYYPFLAFPERAAQWKIFGLLESLGSSRRIEAHRDLLTWVLDKYRKVAGNAVAEESSPAVGRPTESTRDGESNKSDKEWRTKMAAQKRAKVMAQMAAMQKHFMKKNAKLFAEAAVEMNKPTDRTCPMAATSPCSRNTPVAVGRGQTARVTNEETYICILCQEEQVVTGSGPAMVLAAFVQQSTVLCQYRADTDEPDPLFLSAKLGASPYTSTCSHVMHARCWQAYFDNVLAKENRRPYRFRHPASFDVEKHEYLCPLCECLGNTVLPLLPALGALQPTVEYLPEISFETWVKALVVALGCKPKGGKSESAQEIDSEEAAQSEHGVLGNPFDLIRGEMGEEVASIFEAVYGQSGPSLSEDLITMAHSFAQATYTKGFGVEPHDGDSRVPLLVWKSNAYTVHAIEMALRDMDKPLLGALSSRQRDSLQSLARISALLGSTRISGKLTSPTWTDRNTLGTHALSLLTMLLANPHDGASILDWDAFGVLVSLINSLPSLFNAKSNATPAAITSGVFECYALQLVFLSLMVRILLTSVFNESMDIDGQQREECETAKSILTLVKDLDVDIGNLSASQVWAQVKNATLPFLRCCALYFRYVSDVPPPVQLTKESGNTYENLCMYLGLPTTCNELLTPNADIVRSLVSTWKSHPTVQTYLSGASTVVVIREPLKVNKLVDLPEDYSELINTISLFTCPNRDREDSRNPTMCLTCGKMLCSQSYCCQADLKGTSVGACTYHASKCGVGVGIFLRVRECEILFLRCPNRGMFDSSPYLDEYGETDQGLRRGNPLRLCRTKYKQLNRMWLEHGVHESIARTIESASNSIPPQWQHL